MSLLLSLHYLGHNLVKVFLQLAVVSNRDISKNSLLSFRTFLYWTLLGFCHAFVFFFGSYILMGEDTTLMGNGQVCIMYCVFIVESLEMKPAYQEDFPNHDSKLMVG